MPQEPPRFGCVTCGRRWTGDTECHCTRCHQHCSTVAAFDEHLGDRSAAHPRGYCIPLGGIPRSRTDRTPKFRLRPGPHGQTWVLNKTDQYHLAAEAAGDGVNLGEGIAS